MIKVADRSKKEDKGRSISSLADPKGVHGVRSNPPTAPPFLKYPMKNKIIWFQ